MWRSLFLAIGMFLIVVGAECLAIDQATINSAEQGLVSFSPPEWVPWALMGTGAVTMLYSFTLPQKFKGG